jgi:hypothetical protein
MRCPSQYSKRAREGDSCLPCRGRRGTLLAEALIASMAIGTAALLTVSMLITVGSNRITAERTLLATQELSNQLERLTVKPWAELTPEAAAGASLSSWAASRLPNAELVIRMQAVETPRPGKRLQAELRWQDRGNIWRPPLRMTAWVFAPRETP